MKITEKQLILLITVLKESLSLSDNRGLVFSISSEFREKMYLQILNQQSEELKDIE